MTLLPARLLFARVLPCSLLLAAFTGCGPNYSPDTYASNAVQQANKVEQGVIVGVRNVGVSASGTVGTVTGAAAGGIAGAQAGAGPVSALTALGGSLVGGLAGSAVEHASADTQAFEYIVRKPNGELVSVTQKDKSPLAIGTHVLVIAGAQARIVQDYTVPADAVAKADKPPASDKPAQGQPVKLDQPPAPITATPLPPPSEASPAAPAPSPPTPSSPTPSPSSSQAASGPSAPAVSTTPAQPAAPVIPVPAATQSAVPAPPAAASAVAGALAGEAHP